ncbi:copper resistance CopC family protein [Lysinibacillus sp. NPDC097214]|uniref:copper resistance CopC family protein n=1 Tax=Lysinibacillus sp. NPDC097214 TaxID=3390584 RepID=UPI003D0436D1
MIRKIFFAVLFISFLFSAQVKAHTPIEDSNPRDGEVITEELHEVSLMFGTKIEQTSKFDVFKTTGEKIEQANFTLQDNVMKASFFEPLENGSYQVKWSIIGEDGHPIEGIIAFTVDQAITELQSEEVDESKQQVNENIVTTTNEPNDNNQVNTPSYLLPSIIGLLALIAIVSTFVLLRRKK